MIYTNLLNRSLQFISLRERFVVVVIASLWLNWFTWSTRCCFTHHKSLPLWMYVHGFLQSFEYLFDSPIHATIFNICESTIVRRTYFCSSFHVVFISICFIVLNVHFFGMAFLFESDRIIIGWSPPMRTLVLVTFLSCR